MSSFWTLQTSEYQSLVNGGALRNQAWPQLLTISSFLRNIGLSGQGHIPMALWDSGSFSRLLGWLAKFLLQAASTSYYFHRRQKLSLALSGENGFLLSQR